MKSINVETCKQMVIAACDAIIDNKEYLTEVDSKIGDGDHGIGMSGGMEKAKAALLARDDFATINDVFKTTGLQMLNSMGGASGVIFGSMFLGGIKDLEPVTELDGELFSKMISSAVKTIKLRGKAEIGDKTSKFASVSKLKITAAELNGEINKRYEALGRIVYEAQKSGNDISEQTAECVKGIDAIYTRLDDINAKIAYC